MLTVHKNWLEEYASDTNSIPLEDEEETTEIQYEVISISDNIDCMVWDRAISSDAPAVITGDPSVETKGGIKISLIKDSPMKYHIEKDDAGTIAVVKKFWTRNICLLVC